MASGEVCATLSYISGWCSCWTSFIITAIGSSHAMMNKYQTRYLKKVLASLNRDDPKLSAVALNGFAIGEDNEKMAQLSMSLIRNKHVKALCLNNCGITSKGAHLLAFALSHNASLEHVSLNHNDIGSSGADAISAALTKNHTLLTLLLAHNSIGNNGGKALARAVRLNRSITDIFIDGNRMSVRVADEINRICYGGYADDAIESQESKYGCDAGIHYSCTVADSVVSKSFVSRTLDSIEEVEYESDSDSSDGDSTASSTISDEELFDLDFTCFYQTKQHESKLSKLKAMTSNVLRRKKKVEANW